MYFDNCKDKNEVKAMYRKLAMKYHPDRGGDDKTMAEVNAEYEEAFKRVAAGEWKGAGMHEGGTVNFSDLDDGFREVLEKIMNIEDIFVELCGSWLWISGDTRPHKQELKAAGCKWAPVKKMWYWRPDDRKVFNRGMGIKDMSYIRRYYGSEEIKKGNARKRIRA